MYVLGTPGDETTVVLVYVYSTYFFLFIYQQDLTYALGAYVRLIHYRLWALESNQPTTDVREREVHRTRRRHGLHFRGVVFEAGRAGGRTTIIGEQHGSRIFTGASGDDDDATPPPRRRQGLVLVRPSGRSFHRSASRQSRWWSAAAPDPEQTHAD